MCFSSVLSVCLCAGVSQRESQVAQSPLASLGALWLSPARSPGLECLVPAGALPPLTRLLPLHFSLSPPPSFPPSPLPCDSLWAVQKPHALFIYFPGGRGMRCSALALRGRTDPRFKYQPCRLRGGAGSRVREGTLQHYPHYIPPKKGKGASNLPAPRRAGAAHRGAGRSATLRTRTATVHLGAELGCCAAEGAGEPGRLPTPAALSGSGKAACTAERGGEEAKNSRAWMLLARLRRGSAS